MKTYPIHLEEERHNRLLAAKAKTGVPICKIIDRAIERELARIERANQGGKTQ